ncbi:MAG: radical SAM/SPASM domain-containing protein [Candidatus Geothermincolia bacterium]
MRGTRNPFDALLPPGRTSPCRPLGVVQVELTTSCPLQCRMCPRSAHQGWRNGTMPIGHLRRLTATFQRAEAVVLSAWGEPLAYPHLEEAVRLVAQTGARPGFVTSGRGLTAERAAALTEAGLDFLGFSLAGATAAVHESIRVGSALEEVKQAVHTITAARARHGGERPQLHLVYLILRDNLEDLPALPALAQELGIPEVVLTHLIHVTGPWQESQRVFSCDSACGDVQEARKIVRAAADAATTRRVRLAVPPLLPTWPAVCAENPLANLHISAAGDVAPCVYLNPPLPDPYERSFCGHTQAGERLVFGNVFADPVERIWDAAPYREFRACFARRRRRDALGRLFRVPTLWPGTATPRFPPLPVPCRTCHKALGF